MKYLFLFAFFFYSCGLMQPSKEEIMRLLNSEKKNDIFNGVYLAGESKDTAYIPLLMRYIDDYRISHLRKFLGISLHKVVIVALTKISGTEPPHINTDSDGVDSVNVAFFRNLYHYPAVDQ